MSVDTRARRRIRIGARLVTLTVGAAILIAPFLYMLSTSFKPNALALTWPPRFIPHPATLINYTQAWGANAFARYFTNSLLVACASTISTTLLAALAAYAFARFRFPGRQVLFWLLMLGLMVPGVVILIPQYLVATRLHLNDSLPGLVVFYIGAGVALNTFLLRGFFAGLAPELDEAMEVEGAGPMRRFLALYLPLSRPALATSAVFSFLAAWDEYSWAVTSINDPARYTLPIAIAQFQGQHATSWGLVFAASVIAMIPVLVVYALAQRHIVTGLQAGALKS
jgi:ABC-type glycerol-3-phosphate transport system permease component